MRYFIHLLPLLLVCSFVVSPAQAHFAWLYSVDGSARLYFGEGLADRDYHLPEAVANAEVWHLANGAEAKQLAMSNTRKKASQASSQRARSIR